MIKAKKREGEGERERRGRGNKNKNRQEKEGEGADLRKSSEIAGDMLRVSYSRRGKEAS